MKFRGGMLILAAGACAAGCNRSSITVAPSTPVAVITGVQDYAPLDTANFDGSQSYVPGGGQIVDYAWSIAERPQGSTTTLATATDPMTAGFKLDVSGNYQIRLTVTDARGMTGTALYPFHAVPWQTMHIELVWDTDGTDMDIHLVSDDEGGAFFQKPFDCYFDNTNPDWNVQGAQVDDPSIDIDDVDGYGPENVSLERPIDGRHYHVYVHYYDDHGVGSSTASVRIYLNGELRFEGIQAMAGRNDGWDVATIEWPTGVVAASGAMFQYSPP